MMNDECRTKKDAGNADIHSAFCILHSAFPLVRITLAIWAVAFLGLCARTLFLKVDRSSVYPDFSTAGHNWLNGDELYVRGGAHEFRYSPLIAAFFVPFDLLPSRIGEFIWRSINFGMFVGGLYYCCKTGVPRAMSTVEICAVFLLCIPLSVGSLNNAQSNPLVLGLMLFATGGVVRKQWTLSAVCVALATCFKLYPIALGMILMLQYPWKIGWRLLVALAAAATLPLLMQHADYVIGQYTVWVHYLSSEDRQRGPIADWYKDFRALWRVYVMTMRQSTYLIVELSAAAGIAVLCLVARFRKMPIGLWCALALSLACCWMTVLGPATESATYILLAPVVAWGIVLNDANPRARLARIAYSVVLGLFIVSQLAINLGPGGKFFRDRLQPLPLAGTVLFVVILSEAVLRAVEGSGRGEGEV
jgi:hypothetical protein